MSKTCAGRSVDPADAAGVRADPSRVGRRTLGAAHGESRVEGPHVGACRRGQKMQTPLGVREAAQEEATASSAALTDSGLSHTQ